MKVLILIPAYNVQNEVSSIIKNLKPYRDDIVFIDDGSTDETYNIIRSANYAIIQNKTNKGVSYSICRGLEYGIINGYTHVVLVDADGQHPIKYLPHFIEKLKKYDFVFANRFHVGSTAPDCKSNVNILGAAIINDIFGTDLTDISCGFKAFKLHKNYISYFRTCRDYEIVYKILLLAINSKMPIGIVNIDAIYYYDSFLATRVSEIHSFINVTKSLLLEQGIINEAVNNLQKAINSKSDFYILVNNLEFWGFYIFEKDSYIIQANPQKIYDYMLEKQERSKSNERNNTI